jgi:hypothetical protein
VLVAVSMIGIVLHVLMDLPTVYGTRPLSPFDWHWFAVDWLPIVDVYLLMALVIGLLGRPTPAQRRAKAAFVLLLMATNYGVRAASHHQALVLAPRCSADAAAPCDPPAPEAPALRVVAARAMPSIPADGRRCLVELAAMPSFTSPFKWRIIAQLSNAYEIHDIDLLDRRFRIREDGSARSGGRRCATRMCGRPWSSRRRRPARAAVSRVLALPRRAIRVDAQGVTTCDGPTSVSSAARPVSISRRPAPACSPRRSGWRPTAASSKRRSAGGKQTS